MVEVGGDHRSPPRRGGKGDGGGGFRISRGGVEVLGGGGFIVQGGSIGFEGGAEEQMGGSLELRGGSLDSDGGAKGGVGGSLGSDGGSQGDQGGLMEMSGGAEEDCGIPDEDLHVLEDLGVAKGFDGGVSKGGHSGIVDPDFAMAENYNNGFHPQGVRGNAKPNMPGLNGSTNAWHKPSHVKVDWRTPTTLKPQEKKLVLNLDAIKDNQCKLDRAIVGKLMGKKLPFYVLLRELLKKWSHVGEFQLIMLADDCFTCIFSTTEARDEILMGGPWHVAGFILGLDRWSPNFSPDSLEGFTAPIWIRLPKLPLLYWDNDNLSRIAEMVGTPLWIDAFTSKWGRSTFARVCVRIDLSLPLPKGIWIPGIQGNFFQNIEYEGISQLCFSCGVIGHKSSQCPTITISKDPAFGSSPNNSQATNKPTTNKPAAMFSPPHRPPIEKGECSLQSTKSPLSFPSKNSNKVQSTNSDVGNWTLVTRNRWKAKPIPPKSMTNTNNVSTPKSPYYKPQLMHQSKPLAKPIINSISIPQPSITAQSPFNFGASNVVHKHTPPNLVTHKLDAIPLATCMGNEDSSKGKSIVLFSAPDNSNKISKYKSKHSKASKSVLVKDVSTLGLNVQKQKKRKKIVPEVGDDGLSKELAIMETIHLLTNNNGGDISPIANS